jgi:hypothetical protein
MIDLARRLTKPELRPKPVPKVKAKGNGDRTKQPKAPNRASVSQHVAHVTDPAERADADVGTVGDQAESREELHDIRPSDSAHFRGQEQAKRQDDADEWPRPDDQERVRIGRHVRS